MWPQNIIVSDSRRKMEIKYAHKEMHQLPGTLKMKFIKKTLMCQLSRV